MRHATQMSAADTGLLVIDVQEKLVPKILDAERLVGNIALLLDAAHLQTHWPDLASDDAAKGYRTVCLLARHPKLSVPLLREHMSPAHAPDTETRKRVERWLAELDSDEAAVRRNCANAELEKRIVTVETMLRNALTRRPSLEQRKRIERLLERLEHEQVTLGRVLEALEHAAVSESRQLLETLAAGEPETWLTREAKAALRRVRAWQDK